MAKKKAVIAQPESPASEISEHESDSEFKVNKILKHKRTAKEGLKYLLSWVGYERESDNTWEKETSVHYAPEKISTYWATIPDNKKWEQTGVKPSKKRNGSESDDEKPTKKKAPVVKKKKDTNVIVLSDDDDSGAEIEEGEYRPAVQYEPSLDSDTNMEEQVEKKPKKKVAAKPKPKGKGKAKAKAKPVSEEDSMDSEMDSGMDGNDGDDYSDMEEQFETGYRTDGSKNAKLYEDVDSWEELIESVDTIRQIPESDPTVNELELLVIWSLDRSISWIPLTQAEFKFPRHVIKFFVKNLRFNPVEEEEVAIDMGMGYPMEEAIPPENLVEADSVIATPVALTEVEKIGDEEPEEIVEVEPSSELEKASAVEKVSEEEEKVEVERKVSEDKEVEEEEAEEITEIEEKVDGQALTSEDIQVNGIGKLVAEVEKKGVSVEL